MAPTAQVTIQIDAPLSVVWNVMVDFPKYSEWNPFIVGIRQGDAELRVGHQFTLDVVWANGGKVASKEKVTRLSAPHAADGETVAALEYQFDSVLAHLGLVTATREQTLKQSAAGPTTYASREVFHGLLNWGVPLAKVQAGFELHAKALKARAELLARTPPRA